jgi:hypothetical protein
MIVLLAHYEYRKRLCRHPVLQENVALSTGEKYQGKKSFLAASRDEKNTVPPRESHSTLGLTPAKRPARQRYEYATWRQWALGQASESVGLRCGNGANVCVAPCQPPCSMIVAAVEKIELFSLLSSPASFICRALTATSSRVKRSSTQLSGHPQVAYFEVFDQGISVRHSRPRIWSSLEPLHSVAWHRPVSRGVVKAPVMPPANAPTAAVSRPPSPPAEATPATAM